MNGESEGMEQTSGGLTEEQRAANFQDTALADELFERSLTLFVVNSLFSGVAQDPETGDVTDEWLLRYLQRTRSTLSDGTLNRVIDKGLAMFTEMVDEGRTETDWAREAVERIERQEGGA